MLLRGGTMAGVTTQKMQSELERLYPRMTDSVPFPVKRQKAIKLTIRKHFFPFT